MLRTQRFGGLNPSKSTKSAQVVGSNPTGRPREAIAQSGRAGHVFLKNAVLE